ncbi:polyprenyl synthetase family protein [Streptomyces kunmingensis]|uniref:Polyprenyl synthetase family protein n=1 Tax=Streptomyces kunmingensis TaxID=68225 RepID=A0ABU6C7D3_9ACTN|nr:polyprenyl synthetase family protein [Streptomyces kunmingensis]MEB3960610.1 polyprenyl synthetase family protein [Streptomyces kunmingensis]
MPPDEATGAATAVAKHDGADRAGTGLLARDGHAPAAVRARQIDAEVTRTVERRLALLLARRVAEAASVDAVFGADVAERVARFTLGGGRRIRPQFLWWGLRACGLPDDAQIDAALHLGVALELLQTCALIHDDVMDRAPTRRNRPALHIDCAAQYEAAAHPDRRRFGESAAILAGDLALAWADDKAAALHVSERHAGRIRAAWARMRMEMVAGQYLDVQGEATRNRSLSQALGAACLKTARYTVERPLQLGAILGDADEATLRALCSAGRGAGLAFQLRDDLDDVFCDAARRDKPAGGDLRAGKPTYLVALAHARAEADGDRQALEVLRRCLGRPDFDDTDLHDVRHVLERTGARQNVEEKIRRLTAQSMHELDTASLDPVAGARLRTLIHQAAGVSSAPGGPAFAGAVQ